MDNSKPVFRLVLQSAGEQAEGNEKGYFLHTREYAGKNSA
jgi:hypothetical protein